tara:strand:+ start:196 stop:552 length:357 start_codon:yes stop_codon:yes gene_type:complete
MNISLNKEDIHDLSTRIYEIKSPDLGNMEIYKESEGTKKFGADETFVVIDFDSRLEALLAFKYWERNGTRRVALVGYEQKWSIQSDKTFNYEYINGIVMQMTQNGYLAHFEPTEKEVK